MCNKLAFPSTRGRIVRQGFQPNAQHVLIVGRTNLAGFIRDALPINKSSDRFLDPVDAGDYGHVFRDHLIVDANGSVKDDIWLG